MRIQSLLNPFECGETHHGRRNSKSVTPPIPARPVISCPSYPKRQKIPKDAAIFAEADVNGPVNYPPHGADGDEGLLAQHRKFQLYPPLNEIERRSARRIPYNSDKKDFMPKTGREAFEVFQYQFKVPGDEKTYNVLWDYQVGLVRITPFFKCCKYSKTTPAKVLNLNPGLRDISYSITGGALAAQGYWMPYDAAKAVAATFAYNIRYALTPLFGNDFPSTCLHPRDPNFAKFLIDPAIVRKCTRDTHRWREEGSSYRVAKPDNNSPTPPLPPPITTPGMTFVNPPWSSPKTTKRQHRVKVSDQESGYGSTDEDHQEKCVFSPDVSPRSCGWTAINQPYSPTSVSGFSSPQRWLTSVPSSTAPLVAKRTLSKVVYEDDKEVVRPSTAVSTAASTTESITMGETDDEVESKGYRHTQVDFDAATTLLGLRAAESSLHPAKRTRHGSGS
ncbi:uncharacterized protein EI97DRAFT_500789 [Westerdykella ornata]|uniref:HTH APSES-type domain-containing protein n=1 Tax=Westerdykella ornata TaxID=318751 RepID=A0A6A6JKY6_WESOR|nr:uncharacterized protein EI97DRAFT_500789 [Westerdykella ornata]KAF2277177.1 hypothetical protein EI97DRAFT_500789 [Westerdykella ornata]